MASKILNRDKDGHIVEDSRTCNKCKMVLCPSKFREYKKVRSNGESYFHRLAVCRECDLPRIQLMNKTYKETGYSRNTTLKVKYNLSLKDYDDLFKSQDYKCKICRRLKTEDKNFPVDHCHELNIVRGILCPQCNLGLGGFKDNWKLIIKAINYLKDHNEN